MPRSERVSAGGIIYHVLNRGNGRQTIFHNDEDAQAFLKVLGELKQEIPIRLLGWCLLHNHWHLVLWPTQDGQLSRFMQRLTTTHVRRYFAHYHDTAGGHLYQGRFKNFPVQDDAHLLTVLRYVEANALRAGLVQRAEEWGWGSLWYHLNGPSRNLLDPWPLDRPPDWPQIVNQAIETEPLQTLRQSAQGGRPYGERNWVERTAKLLGLEFTLRSRGRPRKKVAIGHQE